MHSFWERLKKETVPKALGAEAVSWYQEAIELFKAEDLRRP